MAHLEMEACRYLAQKGVIQWFANQFYCFPRRMLHLWNEFHKNKYIWSFKGDPSPTNSIKLEIRTTSIVFPRKFHDLNFIKIWYVWWFKMPLLFSWTCNWRLREISIFFPLYIIHKSARLDFIYNLWPFSLYTQILYTDIGSTVCGWL